VATITEDQRKILGDRTLQVALKESDEFSASVQLLFSQQVRLAHLGRWVAVYHGRIMTSSDLEDLLSDLEDEGIPSESSAIGFIE
jgi:hypothetical protein